jgi:integrase
MTSQLEEVLKEHRKFAKQEKLKHHEWKEVPEWMFFNQESGYISYSNFVHRVWKQAMNKSKLARRTPHDMRHTYATLRLSKGDPLPEESKEMGHGSTGITYRTYYKFLVSE